MTDLLERSEPVIALEKPQWRNWMPVGILLLAAMLAGLVGFTVFTIQSAWLETHSQVPDPASYSLRAAMLYERIATEGRLAVAWHQLVRNSLNPMRVVPLVLFAPQALAHPLGQLCTVIPMLFAFVSLFGLTVYRRCGSFGYACACMIAGCAVPGFYNGTWGLGPFWLDLPAGLLIAAAALALLNSNELRDLRWVSLFAVLISWAALSRYVAGVYAFCVCAPVLACYLWSRFRSGESWKTSLLPIGIIGAIVIGLAGYFVIGHYSAVSSLYAAYGFGNKGMWGSFLFTVTSVQTFMTTPYLVMLAVAAVLQIAMGVRSWNEVRLLAIQWWLPVAVVAFLSISCEVGEAKHGTLYAAPLLVIAALVPPGRPIRWESAVPPVASIGIAACSIYLSFGVAHSTYMRGIRPAAAAKAQRDAELAVGKAIIDQGRGLAWMPYYDENDEIVTLEAFHKYHVMIVRGSHRTRFSIHESYLTTDHPKQTPEEMAPAIYDFATADLDVAVVPANPASALAAANNPYSRELIQYFAAKLPADSDWQRAFEVSDPRFGMLVGYRNRTRTGGRN